LLKKYYINSNHLNNGPADNFASPKSSPKERTLKKSEVRTLFFGEGMVRQ